MTEPTACCAARPASVTHYCGNCDLLVGLGGLHVVAVDRSEQALVVSVESSPQVAGCRACGVVAVSHGRRVHQLIDTPSFGRPVRVRWPSGPGRAPSRRARWGRSLSRTNVLGTEGVVDRAGVLVGDRAAAP